MACTLLVTANIRATTRRYRKGEHRLVITLRHVGVRQPCYPSKISSPILKLAFSVRCRFFNGDSAISCLANMENSARTLSEERWRLSNRCEGYKFKLSLQHVNELVVSCARLTTRPCHLFLFSAALFSW